MELVPLKVMRELASLFSSHQYGDAKKNPKSETQKKGSHQKLTVLASRYQISSLQTLRNKFLLPIIHLVYGILL